MNEQKAQGQPTDLVLEYALEAPPRTVWRAISRPEFRETWLPERDLADAEPISSEPGKEVSYRMKDNEPPFLESIVTFQIKAGADGGTVLRIIHGLADKILAGQQLPAANTNGSCLMRAA